MTEPRQPGNPRASSPDWREACAAIIPCHDEAPAIASVVQGVLAHLPTVLVVDDGSRDGTSGLARAAGAQVLRLEQNSGKGAALNAGLRWAHTAAFAWALLLDGDGQHAPEDIPGFFQCATASGADLVVGNRMGQVNGMPALRRWANRWMSARLSRRAGVVLPDSQCGFRLLRLDLWARLGLRTAHFEIESEMLLNCLQAGGRIAFAEVQTRYPVRGQSKIRPLADSLRWVRWWRASG